MRDYFCKELYDIIKNNKKVILITGDLGFGSFNKIKDDFPNQFINVGSSEQLLLGMAIGYYNNGYIPICYSITPFILYRGFEIIRTYINHEKIPIKLVGCGRNKDYLDLGFTHDGSDDEKILKTLENIKIFKPDKLTKNIINEFILNKTPSYLNIKRSGN